MLIQFMLTILKHGKWMTRRQIAECLNRPHHRLNAHDISVLDNLTRNNQIEIKQRNISGVKTEYVYRLAKE